MEAYAISVRISPTGIQARLPVSSPCTVEEEGACVSSAPCLLSALKPKAQVKGFSRLQEEFLSRGG